METTQTCIFLRMCIHPLSTNSPQISMSVSVFMSVCPNAYRKTHTTKLHEIFCPCYLWPWLGLVLLQCSALCTSGFVDNDVIFSHNGAYASNLLENASTSVTIMCCSLRLVEFARWRHRERGRSLMSMIALRWRRRLWGTWHLPPRLTTIHLFSVI